MATLPPFLNQARARPAPATLNPARWPRVSTWSQALGA